MTGLFDALFPDRGRRTPRRRAVDPVNEQADNGDPPTFGAFVRFE